MELWHSTVGNCKQFKYYYYSKVINIVQRFQSKTLRTMANAPWFITNKTLHNDLKIPYVLTEMRKFSNQYLQRLCDHASPLAISLLNNSNEVCRLKRYHVLDLPFRNQ